MKKWFLILWGSISYLNPLFSQTIEKDDVTKKAEMDSITAAHKDSIKWAKLESVAYYPLIKAGTFSGVLPVEGVDEIPSPKRQYKLLFEFTLNFKDTSHAKLNSGLVR